ncbi:MAG: universal stress protein [Pseudomonadota bacterium]
MHRFKNILVVCDEGSAHGAALQRAEWLAETNSAHVTLMDVSTVEPGAITRVVAQIKGIEAAGFEERVMKSFQDRLEKLAEPMRSKGIDVTTVVQQGSMFLHVIQQVLRAGHDLVVKGAEQTPGKPVLRGPDMHLLRKCPCPVWILNAAAPVKTSRILAALDPDPADPVRGGLAQTVMQLATSLAQRDGARLDAMNVWRLQEESFLRGGLAPVPTEDVEKLVALESDSSLARLAKLTDPYVEEVKGLRVLHVQGTPEDVIPDHVAAEGIDTVIMGSVGRTGISGLFIGNTAETILNRVTCSVLAVKPEGFVSPVTLDDGDTSHG